MNRNELISVGTSSLRVSEAKVANKRTTLTIVNSSTGTERITISIDSEAVDLKGRVLYPGGVWDISRGDTFFPTQKQINVISDQATAQISLAETYGED
jgi:hypothetical protein